MITFTTSFQEKVKSQEVKMELAELFKVLFHTIEQRWLSREKHRTLIKIDKVKMLCNFYSLSLSEIFDFKYEYFEKRGCINCPTSRQ